MVSIQTEIEINASKERIYNVLLDLEKHKEWDPFFTEIIGHTEVGSKLKIGINLGFSFTPTVLVNDQNKELRWAGSLYNIPKLFDGEHYFQIYPISENKCKFINGEVINGYLVSTVFTFIKQDTLELEFNKFNQALKERIESLE